MVKLNQVVPILIFQGRTDFILSSLWVNKRVLTMWWSVCYKSSPLIFMVYLILVLPCPLLLHWYLGSLMYLTINEPFMVSTAVGNLVVATKVYRNCPIILPNRFTQLNWWNFIWWILMSFWECIGYMLALRPYIVEQG